MQVLQYIEDTIVFLAEEAMPVFRLQDLTSIYKKQMLKHGALEKDAKRVHSTRMRLLKQLLEHVPGLCEAKDERNFLLTLDKEVGSAVLEACNSSTNDNGIIIAIAAHILRKQLFLSKKVFDGDLIRKRESNSVPLLLLQMIQMMLKDNASKISNESSRVIINISQLIRFNSVQQQRRGSAENVRHCITNEPPLPVAVALMIHSNTRKKTLVNGIGLEGLFVRYERVKDIQRGISNQLCTKYNNDGIICPPTLEPGLFVTSAIDNIDHNLSYNPATSSFHGILISIF